MIVYQEPSEANSGSRVVALFGKGLIGSSVCNCIEQQLNYSSILFPFDWHCLEQCKKDSATIYNYLSSILVSHSVRSGAEVAFVWCAGKAGFTATAKEMISELATYSVALDLVCALTDNFPTVKIIFHLMSSAGGLFEGKRSVHGKTLLSPMRYYGILKHEQEKRLSQLSGKITPKIYRPTSVYGTVSTPDHRMGLIPVLIVNGMRNEVSTIFGSLSTLRDYVFNGDIGAFVTRHLFTEMSEGDSGIYLLGSGKPSSIYEIRHNVEQVIGRKIYLVFHMTRQTENDRDITVNSSGLPADWVPKDIKTGIRLLKEYIISHHHISNK
jgi:nucleoside-diphosphate-sugar epimerase